MSQGAQCILRGWTGEMFFKRAPTSLTSCVTSSWSPPVFQRFDLARWLFPPSIQNRAPSQRETSTTHTTLATFINKQVIIFDDLVHGRIVLAGRSTDTAGARKDDGQDWGLMSSEDIRNSNDLVIRFSWPEGSHSRDTRQYRSIYRVRRA